MEHKGFYAIPWPITSKQQNKGLLKTAVLLLSCTTLLISTQQICQAGPSSVLDPYANIQAPTKEEKQQQFLKQLEKQNKKQAKRDKKDKKSHKPVKSSTKDTEPSTKNTQPGTKDAQPNVKDNGSSKQDTKQTDTTKPKKKWFQFKSKSENN